MLDPHLIEQRLAAYLGAPVTHFSVLASGWETTIFEFVLESRPSKCRSIPVGEPAVLRFYQGSAADTKGAREHTTIDRLSSAGFPVPYPYLFEADHDPLGAPFLIMQRLAGGPLFSTSSFPRAFKTFSMAFFAFVRSQARLHKYDPAGAGLREIPHAFPFSAGGKASGIGELHPTEPPLLDRLLALISERVENGPLPGLRDALSRLIQQADSYRACRPSIVHMDYHPLNVMVRGAHVTGVIDWVNTDVGDRHLDAATTAVILSTSALEKPRWMRDNPIGNGLRASFASFYLPLYHAMAPMEVARFRYCQAVAALLRLSTLGMMRTRGPEAVGFRREALSEVTPAVVRLLSRYASRKCGTPVRLEMA